MTKVETGKFITFMKSLYPRWGQSVDNIDVVVTSWFMMLNHYPVEAALMALQKWASQNKFPPSVNEILETIDAIANPDEDLSSEDAWGLVKRAIGRYGRYNYDEAKKFFPETVAESVRTIGWNSICDEEEGVTRAHFMRVHESIKRRKTEDRLIPPQIRENIRLITEKFDLNSFNSITGQQTSQIGFDEGYKDTSTL